MIGKYSAVKGFALLILLCIFQIPCWNTFSNSESGFLVVVAILAAMLSFVGVFLLYKYEKLLMEFFFKIKDTSEIPDSSGVPPKK